MTKAKIYNYFTDKYGNVYEFADYMSFAKFWFSLQRKYAVQSFPMFSKLQSAAANSREARTKA